ncbi:RICIN domain-containing protein [Kitasatospora camelliae]|uniref:Ricin-type beta-trefoil lectin protein n=1 Tax=Kitasatospora camelliae TaxID=3156397 RepID=A0AAU8JQM5_9ACTN
MSYRPARSAVKTTLAVAAVPVLLLAGATGRYVVDLAPAAPPEGPVPRPQVGLTVLAAEYSGMLMQAFGAAPSTAADGAAVGAMPASGRDSQEWLVRVSASGELVVQSLLASTDGGGPLLLTTDPDDSVYLQHDRLPDVPAGHPAQLWTFDDSPGGWERLGRFAERFRIRAHLGGCLLDHGYGERLTVGRCDDPRSWWTAQSPRGSKDRSGRPSQAPRPPQVV